MHVIERWSILLHTIENNMVYICSVKLMLYLTFLIKYVKFKMILYFRLISLFRE